MNVFAGILKKHCILLRVLAKTTLDSIIQPTLAYVEKGKTRVYSS
jgi:hypothetical protein